MQRSVTPFLVMLGVLLAPLSAYGQVVSGQAKDLQGKPVLNVNVEVLSSDRTMAEYAADIWNVEPCPVS